MNRSEVDEILACLPRDRSLFRYFKDYFALQLLTWASGDGMPLAALRAGPFAPLLTKPVVAPLLSQCGDGWLSAARIASQWQEPSLPFLLTLGRWQGGAWRQTSRPGWNLVLRLNFTRAHDRAFQRMLAPSFEHQNLNASAHPILAEGERPYYRQTLAWTRLDIDLDKGEALIEEIQTDWVRAARDIARRFAPCRVCEHPGRYSVCKGRRSSLLYLDQVLAPYAALWDEAMLSATLSFLIEELGIRDIWYHQWSTGNLLKGLSGRWLPPRSLYTRLPRRFCFRLRDALPELLQDRRTTGRLRRRKHYPRCYALELTR